VKSDDRRASGSACRRQYVPTGGRLPGPGVPGRAPAGRPGPVRRATTRLPARGLARPWHGWSAASAGPEGPPRARPQSPRLPGRATGSRFIVCIVPLARSMARLCCCPPNTSETPWPSAIITRATMLDSCPAAGVPYAHRHHGFHRLPRSLHRAAPRGRGSSSPLLVSAGQCP
jgi:hypothetical protein